MGSSGSTNQKVVKTYVPEYQKTNWKEHADQLGMSQSEYVRTMVQAGRREFTPGEITEDEPSVEEPDSIGSNPRGDGLETRVLESLRTGTKTWDDLVDDVVGDLEADLDDALQSLQADGTVRYSGRTGGYELIEQ